MFLGASTEHSGIIWGPSRGHLGAYLGAIVGIQAHHGAMWGPLGGETFWAGGHAEVLLSRDLQMSATMFFSFWAHIWGQNLGRLLHNFGLTMLQNGLFSGPQTWDPQRAFFLKT